MRPGGTITRIFKSFLVESETYTEDFEQITHESRQVIYTAEGTHYFKDWEEEKRDLDNAFIPVVNIIESNDHQYNIKVVKDKTLTLDACIEEKLRKPEVKEIKLLVNKGNAKLKFNVTKGNPKANDSDGGNITAVFFDGNGKEIIRNELKDKKYGDTFELEIDTTKKIHHIKFYANDNDIFFDGGVSNVYCGEVIFSGCYCNRDFTVEEMRGIVKYLRDNTFYAGKSITYHHKDKLFYLADNLPSDHKTFKTFAEVLNKAFLDFDINTCLKKRHFLAQSYSETMFFTKTKEGGKKLVYDPYRGRGLIQLTAAHLNNGKWVAGTEDSRTHYKTSYLGYKTYSNIDVVSDPDLISNSLKLSADSAGWFWKYGKLLENGKILDINTVVKLDNVVEISKLINGGKEALKQRKEAFKVLEKLFSNEKCANKE